MYLRPTFCYINILVINLSVCKLLGKAGSSDLKTLSAHLECQCDPLFRFIALQAFCLVGIFYTELF